MRGESVDRPHIVLPSPKKEQRKQRSGRGAKLVLPDASTQGRRLSDKLEAIARSFQGAQLSIAGLAPEQVIVFDVIFEEFSGLLKLAESAARIPGLEWLGEVEMPEIDPKYGFAIEGKPDAKIPLRLFVFYSNQAAMEKLLSLWRASYRHGRYREHPLSGRVARVPGAYNRERARGIITARG